jgi:hypothetical protein
LVRVNRIEVGWGGDSPKNPAQNPGCLTTPTRICLTFSVERTERRGKNLGVIRFDLASDCQAVQPLGHYLQPLFGARMARVGLDGISHHKRVQNNGSPGDAIGSAKNHSSSFALIK